MHRPATLRAVVRVFTGLLILTGLSTVATADEPEVVDLSAYFGFQPVEIFKVERRSHSMQAGDFNHDGLTDLVAVDNSHSRLDLLLQRSAPPEQEPVVTAANVNEISSHWRFEHKKVPLDYGVAALMHGDFNNDGRTDLVYFAEPDRLIVRFQPDDGEWDETQTIRLADVEPQPWSIAAGDLNSDGRDDVVVLGKRVTYVLMQSDMGRLLPPQKIRNTAEHLGLALVRDLDGDGRNDLFYVADDADKRKACCRLQARDGRLGPEIRFELEAARGITLGDVAAGAGEEVLNIDGKTGRVRISQFTRDGDDDAIDRSRLVQYGFGESSDGKGRDLSTGDINGDGLTDIVVTDPESAQVIVFVQHEQRGLDLGAAFPSFLGVGQVRVRDVDGDGNAEVFVLSTKEQAIGVARYQDGRLTFPATFAISGEPIAFEVVDVDGNGSPEIVYLAKAGRTEYALHVIERHEDGEWVEHKDPQAVKLANEPTHMRVIDADQNGRPDLLLTSSVGRDPTLLVMDEQHKYAPVEVKGGLQLGAVQHGAIFTRAGDEPATLVAQKSFARSVLLDEDRRWQVLDQFNPAESNAKIEGVAMLDMDGEPGDELVLVDTGVNKLRILRRENELFVPWEEVDLGAFPFLGTAVADLNGDERDDLLVFGPQRFAVLYVERRLPRLKELTSFESKLEDVFFFDLVAGDLNADGTADIAVFDMRSHAVEIVTLRDAQLVHALNFKVFEEKNFSRRGGDGTQPREAVIADVTGDGRDDLILLAHDRVLVYPQDPGGEDDKAVADKADGP